MLKIGEFSRLSQIGIHALRNYDNLGLLQPEHVDAFTGYRYYTLKQLSCAHRIVVLKEMRLSLEQIGVMLNQDMSLNELRGMLRLKRAEIEQRVRDEQKRLAMVEFHLHLLELEDKMPELDIAVKEIPSFNALYLRFNVVEGQITRLGMQIRQLIDNGTIKINGQQMGALYGEEVNPDSYDFAFIIPVTDEQTTDVKLPTGEILKLITMPQTLAATTVVNGHGEPELLEDQIMLERWAVENGYSLCHERRAAHYKGAMHDVPQSEWVAEVMVIIETRAPE